MKKTLVALAVAAMAASAANAAVVYDKDGTKVEVGGSVRLVLGDFGKDQRGDLRNDDSRLEVKASHQLGNGLSALGGLEVRFDDGVGGGLENSSNTFGNPSANKLYAGFAYDQVGTLTFGKQATNSDDVELADYSYTFGGNAGDNLTKDAAKSIKFRSAEWEGFSFGLDYNFGQANKAKTEAGKLKYGYGLTAFYTRDLAQDLKFNFNAAYNHNRFDRGLNTTETGSKKSAWRVASELVYGPASFAAEYGQSKQGVTKEKFLELGAKYQIIEPSAVYVQWQRNVEKTGDDKSVEKVYLAGVDYKFNKNVVTYIEYAQKRSDKKESMYGVGLRVFF